MIGVMKLRNADEAPDELLASMADTAFESCAVGETQARDPAVYGRLARAIIANAIHEFGLTGKA